MLLSVVFGESRVVRYTRRLTNVGPAGSVNYEVEVEAPEGVEVMVKPERLVFEKVGERVRYTVTFVSEKKGEDGGGFGRITWKNGHYNRLTPSPIQKVQRVNGMKAQ
ncbi:hypothetical protein L2E82_02859 [Cichorium intybus]|uniref:Uncharacterized protein n=1 Tax=Cichorium intybus TaxID=13427 RepID=A0ACB9H4Z5_CICIN|nr:hypothetical protein L2E82_02859 [Cichorium intybus]